MRIRPAIKRFPSNGLEWADADQASWPHDEGLVVAERPKLAHLFLVRANLHQEALWEDFFSGGNGAFNIYVHPKRTRYVTTRLFRDRVIPDVRATSYGHVSIVAAELRLLRAAMSDAANKYFLLHSESCIPIRPFSQVYREVFETGRTWLGYYRGHMCRYSQITRGAIREEHFFKAPQFFCLSRPHVALILAKCDLRPWGYPVVQKNVEGLGKI